MKTAAELAAGEIDAKITGLGNIYGKVIVWITRDEFADETQYNVETYISGIGDSGARDKVLIQVDSTDSIYKAREIQRMRLGEVSDVLSDMSDLVVP